MIRVWRLCRAQHAREPLSGEGARIFGGRWNAKGTRLVYCAQPLSLACMETLVHMDLRYLNQDLQAIAIEIPDDLPIMSLEPKDLPTDWDQVPGPESLKAMGTEWATAKAEAILIRISGKPPPLGGGRIATKFGLAPGFESGKIPACSFFVEHAK